MTDQLTPGQLLDAAYRERAHLVAWLAAEYPSVITLAADVDEPGWKLVFIDSPNGQLSWHISPRDDELFEHVERVTCDDPRAQWDGHTTDQKYARIRELTAERAARDGEVQQLRAEVERLHAAQMSTLGELAKAWGRRRRYRQAWQSARHRAQRLRARVADLEQHHKTLCTLVGERSEMVRSARARVSVLESRAEAALARLNLCGMALLHDGYFTEEDEIWPEIAPRITERLAKAREAEAAVARARAFAQELRDYCTPHGISALYADRLEARIDGRQDPA